MPDARPLENKQDYRKYSFGFFLKKTLITFNTPEISCYGAAFLDIFVALDNNDQRLRWIPH